MPKTTKNTLETSVLAWLRELGYQTGFAPDLVPGERADQGQVVLTRRLRAALRRVNPGATPQDITSAVRAVSHPQTPDPLTNNRAFHRLLTDGIDVDRLRYYINT